VHGNAEDEEYSEFFVVSLADAVVQPCAVMIELFDADMAPFAMPGGPVDWHFITNQTDPIVLCSFNPFPKIVNKFFFLCKFWI
jgi:hypothetical protein